MPVSVARARTYPLTLEAAYERTIVASLPDLFRQRHLALPPVTAVEGQVGTWGAELGQTRTIVTSDGGRLRETLTDLTPPHAFGYRIDVLAGPMRPIVDHLNGSWTFTTIGDRTEIRWAWDLHPRSPLATPLLLAIGRMWRGYADRALLTLDSMITTR